MAYLPKTAAMDSSDYATYVARAAFFGAFGRTVQGLRGLLFSKPAQIDGEVPPIVKPQLEDVTLRNESLPTVARAVVDEVLTVGRCVLVLDAPRVASPLSRPYWVVLKPEAVINWRTATVGNDPDQLVQVVIREHVSVPNEDGFGHKVETQYRELTLDRSGARPVYRQRLWRKSDPKLVADVGRHPWTPEDWLTPVRFGQPFDFIPATFIGPTGIDPQVSKPPLEDLADTVVAHYRVSADHQRGLHLVSLPTPWAAGVLGDPQQKLRIGPSVAWLLEKDGKAGMLEFSGAGLEALRAALAALEKQMGTLGARLLIEPPSAHEGETATAAKLRHSAEAASLSTIAGSVSQGLSLMLRRHAWWAAAGQNTLPLDLRVSLSDQLFSVRASADEVRAALMLWQASAISFDTLFQRLAIGGWGREGVTAEQEREAIAEDARAEDSGALGGKGDGGQGAIGGAE
jgi:hypothetical protein